MSKSRLCAMLVVFMSLFAGAGAEDFSDDYLSWETFKYVKTQFYGIPAVVEYCCQTNSNYRSEKSKWKGRPVSRSIYFYSYELGQGEPGSDEYIVTANEGVQCLPYYYPDEKKAAMELMKAEAKKKKAQSERIEEDKKINPDRPEYASFEPLDFHALSNPLSEDGAGRFDSSVCYAVSLSGFSSGYSLKIDGQRFFVMSETSSFSRRRYEFLLLHTGSFVPQESALKYMGTAELMDELGNVRYFDKWQVVNSDFSVRAAIENNPLDYDKLDFYKDSAF